MKTVREGLQGLAAHDNHFSGGGGAEELHVLRDADQQLVLVADGPVFMSFQRFIL